MTALPSNRTYVIFSAALLLTMGLVVNPLVYYLETRYTVTGSPEFYPHQSPPLCFGLAPSKAMDPRIRITPGRSVCFTESGIGIYESLSFTANLTPGAYLIEGLAGLYINASERTEIIINVEIPARGLSAYLLLVGGGGAVTSVNLTRRDQVAFIASPGESYYNILLYVNASKPARTTFRVGIYASK